MLKRFDRLSPKRVFLWLLGITFLAALVHIYKDWLILSNYDPPLHPWYGLIFFQYIGFSAVPFTFPWSWSFYEKIEWRILSAIVVAIGYVLVYLFFGNTVEWSYQAGSTDFWGSYLFILKHSSLQVLLVYSLLAAILYWLGLVRVEGLNQYVEKIPFKLKNKTTFVELTEVEWFEANDNYVSIYSDDGSHYLVRETINRLEKKLNPSEFERVHRKHIVNLKKISSFQADPNGGYFISLGSGKQLKMSKSYAHKIRKIREQQ